MFINMIAITMVTTICAIKIWWWVMMFSVGNLCHVNPPSKNYKKIRQGATHNIRENCVGRDY